MAVRAETQVDLARVDDGTSPTATVTKVGDTATITITDINGTTSESVSDGTNGTNGVSVTSVKPQYYLSTSDSSATGGSWSDTPQVFVSGNYYWTREYVTYSNGTHTESTGVYNSGMTKAAQDAYDAKTLADDTNQYFWFAPTGNDTGAHITEVPQDEWLDSSDPNYHSGGNILIRSNGIAVRDGMTELGQFGADGLTIQTYDANNNTVEIAHLGYGESNAEGVEEDSPYYTLGKRKTTNTAYSSSSTYSVGDLCIYNNKMYVCITAITTAEAWNSNHWQLAYGAYSLAQGVYGVASESYSVAEGMTTIANGYASHAEGGYTKAIGGYAHAEGNYTFANGDRSHAEGTSTVADGYTAHAEGQGTSAVGYSAHAEGYYTRAAGDYSHAQNYYTEADSDYQTVIGKYNDYDPNDTYAFIVGNGTATNARSNAFTVDWNGNVEATGAVTASNIGEVISIGGSSSMTNVSQTANAYVTVGETPTELPVGLWIVVARGRFVPASGTSGNSFPALYLTTNSVGEGWHQRTLTTGTTNAAITTMQVFDITSPIKVYLRGNCNTAGTWNKQNSAQFAITAVRIK